MLSFTTVEESARRAFNITRDEYALCHFIQYYSAHPASRHPGWCDKTREEMADFVGLKKRGLIDMLQRMADFGLVEAHPASRGIRVTARWFDRIEQAKNQRKTGEETDAPVLDLATERPKRGRAKGAVNAPNKVQLMHQNEGESEGQKVQLMHQNSAVNAPNGGAFGAVNAPTPLKRIAFKEVKKVAGDDAPLLEVEIPCPSMPEKEEKNAPQNSAPPPRKKRPQSDYSPTDVAAHLEAKEQGFYAEILGNGVWEDYLTYRKSKDGFRYKEAKSQALAVRELYQITTGKSGLAEAVVNQSRAKGWSGLFQIKIQNHGTANGLSSQSHNGGTVPGYRNSKFGRGVT